MAPANLHFTFDPGHLVSRELALKGFSTAVKAALRRAEPQTLNHQQLMLMLLELAKNTFDHSTGVGVLDLQMPGPGQVFRACYRDGGAAFDWQACSQPGYSAKAGNGVNFGLGLALLQQGSEAMGLNLVITRREDCTEFLFTMR